MTVKQHCEKRNMSLDALANAVGYSTNTKPIYLMWDRVIEPTAELKQSTASVLDVGIDDIDWKPVPVGQESILVSAVASRNWPYTSGYGLARDRVNVEIVNDPDENDLVIFSCKKCRVRMEHILLGALANPDTSMVGHSPSITIGGPLRCGKCGLVTGVKNSYTPIDGRAE